ncbi:MAG: hypothetical protein IT442_05965 [Phycisphaeraceae bacterium]|nr:hypothetical protein [Phycisphaeraceae bacterium]
MSGNQDGLRDGHWRPELAAATWLVPGAGHWFLGRRDKAVVLFLTIMGLWVIGLWIGGVSVIDRKQDAEGARGGVSPWFLAQGLVGPSWGVDTWHQRLKGESRSRFGGSPRPDDKPWPVFEPAVGRSAEIGTLYTAMAGMLNLLVMLEVVWVREEQVEKSEERAGQGAGMEGAG